jgi:DNA-binding transcriptional ArsR family regulator
MMSNKEQVAFLQNSLGNSALYMYVCACKHAYMDEPVHAVDRRPLSRGDAQDIARLMGALGTASRVRILARLRIGPCAVGELSTELEMEQPAVSHQLRVLRDLGLVVGDRDGRSVIYGLFDSHVASLIDEALRHIDHVTAEGMANRSSTERSLDQETVKDDTEAKEATA